MANLEVATLVRAHMGMWLGSHNNDIRAKCRMQWLTQTVAELPAVGHPGETIQQRVVRTYPTCFTTEASREPSLHGLNELLNRWNEVDRPENRFVSREIDNTLMNHE